MDYVTVCVFRQEDVGNSSQLPFKLTFYRDSGGRPGNALREYNYSPQSPAEGQGSCFRLGGALAGQRLRSGNTWVGVSWQASTGLAMAVDEDVIGNTKLSVRARVTSSSNWIAWQDHPDPDIKVFLIRLGVDHGASTPGPGSGPGAASNHRLHSNDDGAPVRRRLQSQHVLPHARGRRRSGQVEAWLGN